MNDKIKDKINQLATDLSDTPLWSNMAPFIKKADFKNLFPKIRNLYKSKQNLKPVHLAILKKISSATAVDQAQFNVYCEYYGLDTWLTSQATLQSIYIERFRLALYCFKPVQWNGKVILVIHGYFEHTLINAWLINLLLSHGFIVYGFDLPGHGYSSGERFTIGEFTEYGDCLKSVINFFPIQPHCIIGHSTGCAAIVDYLTRGNLYNGKVILASPLIKSFLYDYSRVGKKVIDKFTSSLPFLFHKHSNDPDFLLFKRFADIHAPSFLPLSWFDALERWNKIIAKRPINKIANIYIFQGTNDRTVEWKFNLKFIKHQFSNTSIKLLEGAEHNLFNDSDNFKDEILIKIAEILSE